MTRSVAALPLLATRISGSIAALDHAAARGLFRRYPLFTLGVIARSGGVWVTDRVASDPPAEVPPIVNVG